jgi:spore photoproduct lyase
MNFRIDQVWVGPDVVNEPMAKSIIQKLGNVEVLEGASVENELRKLVIEPDPFRRGKRIIRLLKFKGNVVRPCPGTRSYVCCGLEILHIGQGCPMDCTYCALQAYLNSPVLDVFVNIGDMYGGLSEYLKQKPGQFHRICTGEFTDSLALDPLTDLATGLVSFFAEIPNASLELKTKTDQITPLLEVDPKGRTVVSFSVNAGQIIRKDELGSCSLKQRLNAAARLQENGYKLGFHFDPIIPYPNFETDYYKTIHDIAAHVRPDRIAWVSMGVLRFVPQLKDIVLARFGALPFFHDAFLRGLDGKLRLHVDRRIEVYKKLAGCLRGYFPQIRLYLCMESTHVWREALGIEMENSDQLAEYLNEAVCCDDDSR